MTKLLQQVSEEAPGAIDQLIELVRHDLRSRAEAKLAYYPPWRTLDPTALVNEAYVKLFGGSEVEWNNRGHFFMAATRAMHDVLVDRAREARSRKRGGDRRRVALQACEQTTDDPVDVLALHDALTLLERQWPRRADIVRLRFYGGLTEQEIASALQLSRATVRREWATAKAWLLAKLGRESEESGS